MRKVALFEPDLFARFSEVYLEGFFGLCRYLNGRCQRRAVRFLPVQRRNRRTWARSNRVHDGKGFGRSSVR